MISTVIDEKNKFNAKKKKIGKKDHTEAI